MEESSRNYDRSKLTWSPKNMIISKSEALKSSDATLRDVAFGFGKAGVVLLEVTLIWEVMLDCDVLWFFCIIYISIYTVLDIKIFMNYSYIYTHILWNFNIVILDKGQREREREMWFYVDLQRKYYTMHLRCAVWLCCITYHFAVFV